MTTFEHGKWHAWQGVASVLLSDEEIKKLRSFPDLDTCITWLYMNGDKPAARALHKQQTQVKA